MLDRRIRAKGNLGTRGQRLFKRGGAGLGHRQKHDPGGKENQHDAAIVRTMDVD
jgi:hypothetical protein